MTRSAKWRLLPIGIVVVLLGSAHAALAADGDLDPGFGNGGITQMVDVASFSDIARDDLGHIYAVGSDFGGFSVGVYSLLADGRRNPDFGRNGYVFFLAPSSGLLEFPSASLDSQGRLILAAVIRSSGPERAASQFWITRLLPSGQVDNSFAAFGEVLLDVGYNEDLADLFVDDDDRILILGSASDTLTSAAKPVAARITESGTADPGYGIDGVAFLDVVGPVVGTLDRDGRLLVATQSALTEAEVGVFRMLDDGSIDPQFDVNLLGLGGAPVPTTMSIGPDERIVVGGFTRADDVSPSHVPFVMRVLSDGALDRSLNGTGWLQPDLGSISEVAVDGNNRIIVHDSSAVMRLSRNGLPDDSFGVNRLEGTELGPVWLGPMQLSPDGLLVAGLTDDGQFAYVARLEATPFVDDDKSLYRSDIAKLARAGITRGCNPPDNDRFCPDEAVTRGQMAALLVRGLGYADDGGGDLFMDDNGSLFETDIDKLGTAGVTLGCNPPANDRFCPDGRVTRGQMAAFLVRALGYSDDGDGDLFVDDDGSVFESDIDKLGTAGVTLGCNPPVNDQFCPDDPVTRGQMAAFLVRALDLNFDR